MALVLVIGLLPLGAISTKAASYLNYSENLVNLIKQFEGFSASAYWDVNQWTIGYGIQSVLQLKLKLTNASCWYWLRYRLFFAVKSLILALMVFRRSRTRRKSD